MNGPNDTANQHYVSQVEQRLNALNPNATPENQRIYSFSLENRENHIVALKSSNGTLISRTLVLRDLFSFDVIGDNTRFNFETSFQQYEMRMKTNTISFLRKLEEGSGEIKEELLQIFVSKFMNFLRNPFSIRKVLNNIGGVLNFHPTDPAVFAAYNAVLNGKKPQQTYLCTQLGINTEEYRMWLAALFMMFLRPTPTEPSTMEGLIKSIFEAPSGFPMVCVYRYIGEHADKRCLLSDRGHYSPLPHRHASFGFNLTGTAFIDYLFPTVEDIQLPHAPRADALELYRKQMKNVRVIPFVNDLQALARYNQNVIYQCHHAVYSSSRLIFGATQQ